MRYAAVYSFHCGQTLGWLLSGTVMNEAGMNIHLPFFWWHLYSLLVGVYLGLDHSTTGCVYAVWGLPRWLSGKESACNTGDAGDSGLIPVSGRSPGGGNGNPSQYSCLRNPMDAENGDMKKQPFFCHLHILYHLVF